MSCAGDGDTVGVGDMSGFGDIVGDDGWMADEGIIDEAKRSLPFVSDKPKSSVDSA